MVVGSWIFVVFKIIQASVMETSSSVRVIAFCGPGGGGSVVLQQLKKKGRMKKLNKSSL